MTSSTTTGPKACLPLAMWPRVCWKAKAELMAQPRQRWRIKPPWRWPVRWMPLGFLLRFWPIQKWANWRWVKLRLGCVSLWIHSWSMPRHALIWYQFMTYCLPPAANKPRQQAKAGDILSDERVQGWSKLVGVFFGRLQILCSNLTN